MKLIITGGAGFIGSAFVRAVNEYTDAEIVVVDKLTYAADLNRIKGCNYNLIEKCISDITKDDIEGATHIINLSAETHVDNSIKDGSPFIKANIEGVFNLLEVARQLPTLKRFIQMSTDEVYGDIDEGESKVGDKSNPSSYYSATKASADMLIESAGRTYDLPYLIIRACNNFGDQQHMEKFIPKIISNIKNDKPIPVYGDGKQTREWIWVEDTATEILRLVINDSEGIVHIGSRDRMTNIEIINYIEEISSKEVKYNHVDDRLGHDRRYALKSSNDITLTLKDYLKDYFE